jgi:hypothetical protein
MITFTLNEATPLMLCEALRVRIAEVDCPELSAAFSLSHVTTICPAALAGLHANVVILKDKAAFPVFFT